MKTRADKLQTVAGKSAELSALYSRQSELLAQLARADRIKTIWPAAFEGAQRCAIVKKTDGRGIVTGARLENANGAAFEITAAQYQFINTGKEG